MTSIQTLVARIALSSVAAAVSVVAVSNRQLREMRFERFERLTYWAFAVSRLGLFGLVFLVLHLQPRGDVPIIYFREAAEALQGKLPYRDFWSSYAPLHPYLDGLMLRAWFSPLAIIFGSICAEGLVLPLWFRAGRSFLTEPEIRMGAILYVTSAFSLQFVAIDGQDNVILAALLAIALLLLQRKRALLSGAAIGLGVAAIKFLPLIYAPAFFVSFRRRWRWAAGMAAVIGAVYGSFAMLRLPLLVPLQIEGTMRSAGNLPYVVEALIGRTVPGLVFDGGLLLVFGLLFALTASVSRCGTMAVRLRALTFCLVAVTLAMVLFAKKSWPAYLMLTLFPMCTLIRRSRPFQTASFAFLTVVAVVEHSYFAGYLDSASSLELHLQLVRHRGRSVGFLGIELLLLLFYGWMLAASTREIAALRQRPIALDGLPQGGAADG